MAQNLSACSGRPVSERDVSSFERWRVPWGLLDDLAGLTGTTREWLLYGEGEALSAEVPGPIWERPPEPTPRRRRQAVSSTLEARAGRGLLLGLAIAVGVWGSTRSTALALLALAGCLGVALLREPGRSRD